MKTIVNRHPRKTKRKLIYVKRHPRKIGSRWKGEKYIHGPRKISPKQFSEFKLGPIRKSGKRFVFGKLKKSKKWAIQSELTPIYSSYPRVSPTLDRMEQQLEERKKTANIKQWANIIEEEKHLEKMRKRLIE